MRKNFALLLLIAGLANAKPIDGMWRAVLTSPGGELPFALRFEHGGAVVVNGTEHVPVSGVIVDGARVTIRFDWYDSAIRAEVAQDGNVMNGVWTRTVPSRTARMAFHATRGARAAASSSLLMRSRRLSI